MTDEIAEIDRMIALATAKRDAAAAALVDYQIARGAYPAAEREQRIAGLIAYSERFITDSEIH